MEPHIVILGAGFGGMAAVKNLKSARAKITLIDQYNYHLFQPLLYQVATANFSPADIASPIRNILKNQSNAESVMETVKAIDKNQQMVVTCSGNYYIYDYLIIATGAQHSYFGNDHWACYAPGLKCLEEAEFLREKILFAFEAAETSNDPITRKENLTFIIIGGGPTGVEMAGAVRELASHSLVKEFKHINPASAEIILIEAAQRILNAFPEKLAKLAERRLRAMGVKVYTEEKVLDIGKNWVALSSHILKAKTIIWAAGVKASNAAVWLDIKTKPDGRIVVSEDLSIPQLPNIFVIGDSSAFFDKDKNAYLPGTAAVAKQQGRYVGKLICQKLKGRKSELFYYRDMGNLATIGHKYAIADFKRIKLTGFFAYILWWIVHIYFLIGFRNRFFVLINWLWSYFTFERSARLIIRNSNFLKKTNKNGTSAQSIPPQ